MRALRVTESARLFRLLLLAGLVLRAICLPLKGTADVDIWKTWSYAASHRVATMYGVGGHPPERRVVTWGSRAMTVDYPPAALFGLGLVGRCYRAIDPAFTDGTLLTITIKFAILLGDAGTCAAVWLLVRRRYSPAAARAAALFYWLNPAVLMDGAVLGYLDSWAGALAACALLVLGEGAFAAGGAVLALAVLTKLQAILLLPAGALLILHRAARHRWRGALAATAGAAAAMALLLAPFARIGALANVRQGVGSLLRHDMLSAEAANVWWIVTWLLRASYATADMGAWRAWTMRIPILGISRVVALGYPNPRPIGMAAVASLIAWVLWRARRAPEAVVLAAAALTVHTYFTFSVQVHENHLYFAFPVLAAAAAVLPNLRGPLYLLSAVFALNLFLFYGFGRDFSVPSRAITIVDSTVVLSFVNVGALIWHVRRFASVCPSEQSAGPASIDGNSHAGHVRRRR